MAAAMRPQNVSFKNQTMRAVLFRKEKRNAESTQQENDRNFTGKKRTASKPSFLALVESLLGFLQAALEIEQRRLAREVRALHEIVPPVLLGTAKYPIDH